MYLQKVSLAERERERDIYIYIYSALRYNLKDLDDAIYRSIVSAKFVILQEVQALSGSKII